MPVKRDQVALWSFALHAGSAQSRQLRVNNRFHVAADRSRRQMPSLFRHFIQHRLQRIGCVDQRMPICHCWQRQRMDRCKRPHDQRQIARQCGVAAYDFFHEQRAARQLRAGRQHTTQMRRMARRTGALKASALVG